MLPSMQPAAYRTMPITAYRPDIDGLRAICIVSVIMFHAGFRDWAGGFVGVDIFFVISGYLITALIGRQVTCGEFSLLGFYERRVRRLLAATIPVVLFTTLFALAFYSSRDFSTYGQSLIAFIAYSSNWFFLSQAGYFATPAETSPLLHTWSLGVEQQFYLLFPALLMVLLRYPRAARRHAPHRPLRSSCAGRRVASRKRTGGSSISTPTT